MSKLSSWKTVLLFCVFCGAGAVGSPAQTFTTLYSFCAQASCTDGTGPWAGLVQGTDGNFYGTTVSPGTVFKISPAGKLTTIYTFCSQPGCTDGGAPYAGLVLATNGNFYGTTQSGGVANELCGGGYYCGTVFEITPEGKLTTLHSFDGTDGYWPYTGLIQASNGNFYGTTGVGGPRTTCPYNLGYAGCGTVFEITAGGKLTTPYSFCSQPNCTDGALPDGVLVQGTNGNFYGTTEAGGAYGLGTVFEMTPAGKLTTLHSFCPQPYPCSDGESPLAGLVQASNENFYGTASGGTYASGTVFKITAGGALTTLHSFDGTDGDEPEAELVQATDGNFYGTTFQGGANSTCVNFGCGTVFEITPGGTLTTLHTFCAQSGCPDGLYSPAAVVQGTNGNFYGTTVNGGTNCGFPGCGTIFSLSVGLGPFVETVPTSGKIGTKVTVLGNNLMGATSVTFNGTPAATFKASSSEITTTVPSGATTGKVVVTVSGHMLTSNVNFRVP